METHEISLKLCYHRTENMSIGKSLGLNVRPELGSHCAHFQLCNLGEATVLQWYHVYNRGKATLFWVAVKMKIKCRTSGTDWGLIQWHDFCINPGEVGLSGGVTLLCSGSLGLRKHLPPQVLLLGNGKVLDFPEKKFFRCSKAQRLEKPEWKAPSWPLEATSWAL